MTQKISGGCACGAIHYECNVDPVVMVNCHCRDCQRASGGAYAAILAVPKAAVQMRGDPSLLQHRWRLRQVGRTRVLLVLRQSSDVQNGRLPDVIGVQAASLDDPSIYRPDMDVFTSSAQAWDHMDPSVQKYSDGPPF